MKLYIATRNPGKLRDFAVAAESCSVHLLPLPNLEDIPAPREDGFSFAENARTKALYYASEAPGLMVIADDSGLEVDALYGSPGVRSARFAQDAGISAEDTDAANNEYLLSMLKEFPLPRRTARYRCALAAAMHEEVIAEGDGTVEGVILTGPRGTAGFGYDPLFLLPQIDKTMAEIDLNTKLKLSHRGAALRNLVAALPAEQ